MDRVRVLRVLEYVGPRDWVERTLSRNAVKGSWMVDDQRGCVINSAIITEYPEILGEQPIKEHKDV